MVLNYLANPSLHFGRRYQYNLNRSFQSNLCSCFIADDVTPLTLQSSLSLATFSVMIIISQRYWLFLLLFKILAMDLTLMGVVKQFFSLPFSSSDYALFTVQSCDLKTCSDDISCDRLSYIHTYVRTYIHTYIISGQQISEHT